MGSTKKFLQKKNKKKNVFEKKFLEIWMCSTFLLSMCLENPMCSTDQIGTPRFVKVSSARNDEHRIFSRWLLLCLIQFTSNYLQFVFHFERYIWLMEMGPYVY